MRQSIVEYWRLWPIVLAAAMFMLWRTDTMPVWIMLGLTNPRMLFAKVERFRSHGLDVAVACDLAAEQTGEDPAEVAVAHLGWRIEQDMPDAASTVRKR